MASIQKIRTNFWFDSNAEEAANFYCGLLPNSEITMKKSAMKPVLTVPSAP